MPVFAVLALALGASVSGSAAAAPTDEWPQFGATADHSGVNPVENTITPHSVTNLHVQWTGRIGGNATSSSPVVANGIVYVGSSEGTLDAFNVLGCLDAFGNCKPLWQGKTRNGIYGAPAVVDGTVFVASADRFLYAFDAFGCGHNVCPPLWTGWLGNASLSSLAVSRGTVFVTNYGAKVLAFSADGCGSRSCHPKWVGLAVGHSASSPAVGDGFVYFETYRGNHGWLYAFDANGCATPPCAPAWRASLGGPAFADPTVSHGNVYAGTAGGQIDVFGTAGCGAAVCTPVWSADVGETFTDNAPAVNGNTLYVAGQGSLDPNRIGVVEAFPAAGCGASVCEPVWTGGNLSSGTESAPAIAGGVVLVAKGPASGVPVDAGLYAYRAGGCGAQSCTPLVFTQVGIAQDYLGSSVAIAEGHVFFASFDNSRNQSTLYALQT